MTLSVEAIIVRAAALLSFGLIALPGCGGAGGHSGKELYEKACARCHGEAGTGGIATTETGGVASRELSDAAWQKTVTDEEMRQIIRDGRRTMPAFGHALSVDKIDAIVKHVRTLAGPVSAASPGAPEVPAPGSVPAQPGAGSTGYGR
jgi:mono/diheme cytochrome c family protein